MDENKKEIIEETSEEVEETVEEVTEEVAEETVENTEAEEFVEELFEDAEDEEDSIEAEKYIQTPMLIDQINSLKKKNRMLKVLSCVLIVLVAGFGVFYGVKAIVNYNPYNNMGYPNVSSLTVENFARMNNITVEEVIKEFQLPEDVKDNTYYDVLQYIMPTSAVVEKSYGMDFETAKATFNFNENITPETPWGETEDSLPLSLIVGDDEAIESFVEFYELDENITGDTLWGEIRREVLMVQYNNVVNPEPEENEEVEEVIEENDAPNAESVELSEEELAEIMAYLEAATGE